MNYDTAKIWIDLAQFLLTGLIAVWLYFEHRHDRTHERIGLMEAKSDLRFEQQNEQLIALRCDLNNRPEHQDLALLCEKTNELAVTTSKMEGEMQFIRRMVEDINRFLRESK